MSGWRDIFPGEAEGPAGFSAEGGRVRLLFVDADMRTREILDRRLTRMGYAVRALGSGAEALEVLEGQRIDAVLIDLSSCGADGIETVRKMRVSSALGGAPILTIAAQGDHASLKRALDAGADDHIAKPFDFDGLDARIRHEVRRADRVERLSYQNRLLDARIARRAVELGETRSQLEALQVDRRRLVASIEALNAELEHLRPAS